MQAPSPDKPKSDPFELLPAILILGFAGGFFDAYTYVARGGVFCNAQTGNLILMTLGICGGEGIRALRYLIPVAFSSWPISWATSHTERRRNAPKRKGSAYRKDDFFIKAPFWRLRPPF